MDLLEENEKREKLIFLQAALQKYPFETVEGLCEISKMESNYLPNNRPSLLGIFNLIKSTFRRNTK